MRVSQDLGNDTFVSPNSILKTLFNKNYPPKPGDIHLRLLHTKRYFLKLPQCFQKKMQWPDFEVQDSDCTHTNPFNYFDRVGRIFHSDLVVLRPVVVVNCCANVAHSLTL